MRRSPVCALSARNAKGMAITPIKAVRRTPKTSANRPAIGIAIVITKDNPPTAVNWACVQPNSFIMCGAMMMVT